VSLTLRGRRVVVAGGGTVATRRVSTLLDAGAAVHVVAPELSPTLAAWVTEGRLTASRRSFRPEDLDGAWLALTATGQPGVDAEVVGAAEARRCFVSSAGSDPPGSFAPLAVLRRGDLEVAVGTSGRSPAVSTWLRQRLETLVGPEYGTLLDIVAEARNDLRVAGRRPSERDWQAALDSGILESIRAGRLDEARGGLWSCLSLSSG
jgi:siroheme synthase-like protein